MLYNKITGNTSGNFYIFKEEIFMNFLSMFTVPVIQTLSYYDDAVNTVTLFIELIALLIGCCGWGFVTKKVGENRGH